MKLGIFVTGTNTGIGKTIVSSLLISSLKSYGIRTGYFKPVQTGLDLDSPTVVGFTGLPISKFPDPVYSFPEATAPYRAALLHDRQIQLDSILQKWNELDDRAWVLEGAGGLLVPLTPKHTVREMIQCLGLRLILVSSTKLGTINHTLLSVEAAKAAGLTVAGIILVGEEDPGLESVLMEFSQTRVLARVPQFTNITAEVIQKEGPEIFPIKVLRELYD